MKSLSLTLSFLAAELCLVLAGCARQPAEKPAPPKAAETVVPSPAEISIRAVSAADFTATVERRRGKVVLVDYWATWCEPCTKLFPHTVTLHRELAGEGLAVVSVSLDEAEDEPAVLRFLTAQGAAFENLRSQTGASSRSFTEFEIERGIPFMQLYDRAGKLRKKFLAPFKPDQVREAVKQLLAEPAFAT
jgi:thiol-disulfide isomerase/thioredoxin